MLQATLLSNFINFFSTKLLPKQIFYRNHFLLSSNPQIDTSITDTMTSTTENVYMSSIAEQNADELHSHVEQTTKMITSTDAITTNQTNEVSTSIPSAINAESDATKQTEKPIEEKQNVAISQSNVHGKPSISVDSIEKAKHENENMERVSITYATHIPTTTTAPTTTTPTVDSETEMQEQQTKSNLATSTSTASPIRKINENDRRQVVSKDDIESIRGRALNFSSTENAQQKFSGIVYVTAPTTSSLLPKSSKSFQNDLSNVDMDVDDNFHNNEHLATATTTIPLIHDSDKSNTTSPSLIHNSG